MPSCSVLQQKSPGSRKADWGFVFVDISYVKLPCGRRGRQRPDTQDHTTNGIMNLCAGPRSTTRKQMIPGTVGKVYRDTVS